jgi:hypothetical protein
MTTPIDLSAQLAIPFARISLAERIPLEEVAIIAELVSRTGSTFLRFLLLRASSASIPFSRWRTWTGSTVECARVGIAIVTIAVTLGGWASLG